MPESITNPGPPQRPPRLGGVADRTYEIAVLARAFDVLDCLARSPTALGPTELARQIGTTKSATFRILVNLERRGYVRKDHAARYLLGTTLLTLGARARAEINVLRLARPYLEALSAEFRETANLAILDQQDILYLEIVESPQKLRMASAVGARDRPHATALGKAMLAFLPTAEVERFLQPPLEARTDRTRTDPVAIKTELDLIRQSGVAVEIGENEPDARCIGAPVFDSFSQVCAAISVAGPASRMEAANAGAIEAAVVAAARSLTRELGGTWPLPQAMSTGEPDPES